MYLFKTANHNCYTRICLPKKFRDLGCPFDLKVSLLTKNRQLASFRNLTVAIELKQLIDSVTPQTHPADFKFATNEFTNTLRSTFVEELDATKSTVVIPVRPTSSECSPEPTVSKQCPILKIIIKKTVKQWLGRGKISVIQSDLERLIDEGRMAVATQIAADSKESKAESTFLNYDLPAELQDLLARREEELRKVLRDMTRELNNKAHEHYESMMTVRIRDIDAKYNLTV